MYFVERIVVWSKGYDEIANVRAHLPKSFQRCLSTELLQRPVSRDHLLDVGSHILGGGQSVLPIAIPMWKRGVEPLTAQRLPLPKELVSMKNYI